MGRNVKLPLQEPFSVTFPMDANAVSILLNEPKTYSWLMNCFIQLTCRENQFLDYYDFYYRNCPLLSFQRIKAELAEQTEGGLIGFISAALENGYYVILSVETKYISRYDFDFFHDMMIYGHEDERLFYIADNFSQGKYSRSVCGVEELIRATNRIKEPQTWRRGFEGTLELLSYREEERAEFELYRVIESLKDYLESRATSRWNVNWDMMWDTYENENRCFGMQCYEGIYHNIQIAREEKSFAESGHRALFLEQEHKKIMELRLQFIRERYPISEDIISEYHRLSEICGSAMCLKLKYDITKKEELLDRIEGYFRMVQEKEMSVLSRLVSELGSW